ncbi:hypothetical protein Bsp3421_003029 [Burkholderia sp. FERM BP-3421]|jgi:hypothetical protein|uniref:hypothetical protein n=1 Tax=Burkholderia sp. FERM BP-3421 TaxID=1494466 RepID=UPI00235E788E|nr:hypothetical protein [Burkholderia sp. FERM BP-3421]WDD92984.1 hypothetical protein Bsp3421_003029 [Burkholderia sp. FERM BP-3421]
MTEKHSPITGFRIARPSAARSRMMTRNRLAWRSEVRRLLEEILANELRRSLARTSVVEPVARPTREPARPLPRTVFDVGPIDPSKCMLPIISEAEARAVGGRETFMHFGLDPDLYSALADTL